MHVDGGARAFSSHCAVRERRSAGPPGAPSPRHKARTNGEGHYGEMRSGTLCYGNRRKMRCVLCAQQLGSLSKDGVCGPRAARAALAITAVDHRWPEPGRFMRIKSEAVRGKARMRVRGLAASTRISAALY